MLFLGEDVLLSGESHSRAFLDLPGSQIELLEAIAATGKPVVAVVMAGRPLVIDKVAANSSAVIYAWHPGSLGGPAIADILFGDAVPSGKVPVSFPRASSQLPVYYSHKNTGRPPLPDRHISPTGTPLNPHDFCTTYLDVDHRPLYPFGYGLSYTTFEYSDFKLSSNELKMNGSVDASVVVTNTGNVQGVEIVQLYARDLVGSVTRPIKELIDFRRVALSPGESQRVSFSVARPCSHSTTSI